MVVFDIDGTLTRSKQQIDIEMAELLCQLLADHKVAIISGASFTQFQWQILERLKCSEEKMRNLYLLPVDGTVFCYEEAWLCRYDEPLSSEEKERIKVAFQNIFEESGLPKPDKTYGEVLEDRGAQLNFSAFGQDAPIELKESWDMDGKKRSKMVEVLKRSLSDFSIHFGGTTSIEVTRFGVDKAYGLKKLMKETGISKEKILYFGDKLSPGGNDTPVKNLGIKSLSVNDPEETKKKVSEILGL